MSDGRGASQGRLLSDTSLAIAAGRQLRNHLLEVWQQKQEESVLVFAVTLTFWFGLHVLKRIS